MQGYNKKYVYQFSEGNACMCNLLGRKGANLSEMIGLGFPVPNGFTITSEVCARYYDEGKVITKEIENQIYSILSEIEQNVGKKLGDPDNPFLVSVRSSARAAMPGLMDTILNLGLNDTIVESIAKMTGNVRFVYDSYRRFIQMFSDVVMEIDKLKFDKILDAVKHENNIEFDTDLNSEKLKEVVKRYKELFKKEKGFDFPQDPKVQLMESVKAVFRSWDNPRAMVYRRLNNIPGDWGTAAIVQEMVYGNMGNDSGTGVAFTRNPSTGERKLYGEFLINAQGEDVVAGIRTPQSTDELKEIMPEVYNQLVKTAETLEKHFKDMQDMEFTIENGKLYILHSRNAKRTANAAIKLAVDFVSEGLITITEAIMKIDPKQIDAVLHPNFNPNALKKAFPLSKGLPASPGAACGRVYFSSDKAIKAFKDRQRVILVKVEMSPEDIEGMHVSQGILTGRGGMTSHASVVARGMGTCCVAGCGDLKISSNEKSCTINGSKIIEGDYLSLDGSTGNIYLGEIEIEEIDLRGDLLTLLNWANKINPISIRTNADTAADIRLGIRLGADGVGLMRTEHMFFEKGRIASMREFILSDTHEQRMKAIDKLLPLQKADFKEVFSAMCGRPIAIRLFDPPLHDFWLLSDDDIKAYSADFSIPEDELLNKLDNLFEKNPILGHRGVRIYISYPEILEMQLKAIIGAAIEVNNEFNTHVIPEIIVPMVCCTKEFQYVKNIASQVVASLAPEQGCVDFKIGVMIETPRSALIADELAKVSDFFSFATNDLTQMTYGISRDDANKYFDGYYNRRIFDNDPFYRIDKNGVGSLIIKAIESAHKVSPKIKYGVCGEHASDPSSIGFFIKAGLTYVSCSPYRIPISRLAAAQALITQKTSKKEI